MPRHDEGFFNAKDNLRLFWESDLPDAPRAHVGLVHGYADHIGRYRSTIDALVKEGYAIHGFDYRGHGQSDGRRGYVDRFSDYLDDMEVFWGRVRKAAGGQKCFLLGHSHGGLISLHFQARKPQGLEGLILSSPWLEHAVAPPWLKVMAGRLAGKLIPWLPVDNGLKPEHASRDPEARSQVAKDPLYNRVTTPRWYEEARLAQQQALLDAPKLAYPVLMFFGTADEVADPVTNREYFGRIGSSDKTLKEYVGVVHEPLNDFGKEQVWRDISGWISARL
jgi:lysophospholipase